MFLNRLLLIFGTGNFDELRREYRVEFGCANTVLPRIIALTRIISPPKVVYIIFISKWCIISITNWLKQFDSPKYLYSQKLTKYFLANLSSKLIIAGAIIRGNTVYGVICVMWTWWQWKIRQILPPKRSFLQVCFTLSTYPWLCRCLGFLFTMVHPGHNSLIIADRFTFFNFSHYHFATSRSVYETSTVHLFLRGLRITNFVRWSWYTNKKLYCEFSDPLA